MMLVKQARCKVAETVTLRIQGNCTGMFIELESGTKVTKGWGGGNGRYCFVGVRVYPGVMNKFCRWQVVIVAQHCRCTLHH